jgi:hypothetical protein
MVTNGCTGLAQRHNLGVGRRVGVGDVAVPAAADDPFPAHDHGSNGDFARFQRALR